MRLGQCAAMSDEIVRHLLQRVLILDARRDRIIDEPALMELLAMRQHIGDERDADRAPGIARRVEQGRGLVGLVRPKALTRTFESIAPTGATEGWAEIVAQLLGAAAGPDKLPAFSAARRAATARHFIELTMLPMVMRALFGEPLTALRAEIAPHVARTVAFFLAACRQD